MCHLFLSNRLQTLALWSLGIEACCYDFFNISQLFFWIIQDFLGHYVWIDVGSIMYMSGEAPFIAWVESDWMRAVCPDWVSPFFKSYIW